MNSKTVKLGFISRLMLGEKSLSLENNGVRLGNKILEYPRPLQKLKYIKSFIFDKLVWGEISFKFIRSKELRAIFFDIERSRLQYWAPVYREYFNQLIETSEKFENYLTTFNRYIRGSYQKDWIERLNKSKPLLSLKEEYSTLGFDINDIREALLGFLSDPDGFVVEKNQLYIKNQLISAHDLFENVEEHPLTERQREACVYDEDNVLVIAGAGTGKTSTMAAKAAYLVKQGFARPEEILMIAFGKDARKELEDRVYEFDYLNDVVIRTFHSLGKEIIGHYENRATDVSVLATDDAQYIKFIDDQIEKMTHERSLEKELRSFLSEYQYPQPNDLEFKSNGEYLQYVKDNEIRDLAGNLVKSFEELKISNYLFKKGIRFEYETEYPYPVSSPGRSVYRPDYYLPDLDVFIEHFGINELGETRRGIDKVKYNKDKEWKIKVHQECGTKLIQTFSYESKQGIENILESKLKEHCKLHDFDFEEVISPITTNNLFGVLKELGAYKTFSKLIANFLILFKSSTFDIENLPVPETNQYNRARISLFHLIFKWVYERYCLVLNTNMTMDFADMIRDAERIVRSDDFHDKTQSKYRFRYIMVDEFQDISPIRAGLIKALRDAGSNCGLFCVGDDWQAIYRFTGSDVSLTTKFSEHFGKTYPVTLDKSFRFNDRIESVASGFVQENKDQLRKDLITHTRSNKTEVNVSRGHKDEVLREIFTQINSDGESGTSVLVISRFRESLKKVAAITKQFQKLKINQMTAHASKGKQADYVIILDVIDGKYGFPSKLTTDPLLESLLPTLEEYLYAEERRLFYVALTRAKKTVFIHTELGKESDFLKEMKAKKFDIQFDTNELAQYVIESAHCPECGVGSLIPRFGQFGLFYTCSLGKAYCDTLVPRCPACGKAPLLRNSEFHYCASPECSFKEGCCPVCSIGRLVTRKNSRTGREFIGCSNFKGNEPGSCTYSNPTRKSKLVQ